MIADAALFFFGAVQHAGVAIGPYREPRISPQQLWKLYAGFPWRGALPRSSVIPLADGVWR